MKITTEMLPTAIGMMSLIGTGHQRPVSWGNYFWLAAGPRVLNFWAENLTAANEQFALNGKVRCRRYQGERADGQKYDFVLIDDPRIPSDWYYNKLCTTGGYGPPPEAAKDMYEYLGDPTYELEQYIDPVSYYAKRGGKYNPATGCISYEVKATPRKLNIGWSIDDGKPQAAQV